MSAQWNRYGRTQARQHGRPGREMRPSGLTVDIHAHVMAPEAVEFVKPHLDLSRIPLAHFAGDDTKALNRQQDIDRTSRFVAYEDRLSDLDEMGIDIQVVMPSPGQCYFALPIDIAVPATQMVNDAVAAYVAGRPDRFLGFGTVPMQDAGEAVRELDRIVSRYGFKGVQILTNVDGRELSDPAFEPFWTRAEQLGTVVLIHPNGFTEGGRLSRHYFNNVIGNPLETTIALHYLIFDGVLDRHPKLKILAPHGGGYLAAYHGRIDHAWGARSDCRGAISRPPGEYLRQVYVDTVVFTAEQLEALVGTFGIDNVLMGTDYPFDMAEYDPIGHLRWSRQLTEGGIGRIAGDNARKLLGL